MFLFIHEPTWSSYMFLFWPGVVAPDFKVHRTANLRIVDASVIPLTFSVAPLATVFAIAEKVTSLISFTIRNTLCPL